MFRDEAGKVWPQKVFRCEYGAASGASKGKEMTASHIANAGWDRNWQGNRQARAEFCTRQFQ